jgi:hypothetical protein
VSEGRTTREEVKEDLREDSRDHDLREEYSLPVVLSRVVPGIEYIMWASLKIMEYD